MREAIFVQLCRVVFNDGGTACLGLQGFLDGLFLLRTGVCVCAFSGVLGGFSLRSLHCLFFGLGGGILLCHEYSFLPVCFDSFNSTGVLFDEQNVTVICTPITL